MPGDQRTVRHVFFTFLFRWKKKRDWRFAPWYGHKVWRAQNWWMLFSNLFVTLIDGCNFATRCWLLAPFGRVSSEGYRMATDDDDYHVLLENDISARDALLIRNETNYRVFRRRQTVRWLSESRWAVQHECNYRLDAWYPYFQNPIMGLLTKEQCSIPTSSIAFDYLLEQTYSMYI